MKFRMSVAFVSIVCLLLTFELGFAQLSKVDPIVTEWPDKVIPKLDNALLIDDLFDVPEAWNYVPDKPKTEGRLKRPVTVPLGRYIDSVGFASADSNTGVFLKKVSYSKGGGDTWEYLVSRRFKLSNGVISKEVKLIEMVTAEKHKHIDRKLKLPRNSLRSVGIKGDVILTASNQVGRVDLWSISGKGKHLCGWQPYGLNPKFDERLSDALVHSAERAFTLNYGGDFLSWKLPECEVVYKRKFSKNANIRIRMSPGYSPNFKHMAVWSDNNLLLVDLDTGKTLGILPAIYDPGFVQPTFSPDGSKLACSEIQNTTPILVVYDLKTGKVDSRIPFPETMLSPIKTAERRRGGFSWVDNNHGVVAGAVLVDLNAGKPIWKFNVPPRDVFRTPTVASAPGYGFWYCDEAKSRSLRAIQLPHEAALRKGKDIPNVFVANPGSKVSLAVDVSGAPKEVGTVLNKGFVGSVETAGFQIGKGEPLKFHLNVEVVDKGQMVGTETLIPKSFGGVRKKKAEDVAIKSIVVTASATLDGREVWKDVEEVLPSKSDIFRPDPEKTFEEQILEKQWEHVKKFTPAKQFKKIPAYLSDPELRLNFPSSSYPVSK